MGKLYVVGIGPGCYEDMTIRADKALRECDVVAGYTVYCDLLRPYFPDKEYLSTPMMGEEKRVAMALERAGKGQVVALVCSGDAGVYGMAGLAFELAQGDVDENVENVEIEVIPGVTAAISGAALLGAPLIHDFCLISLSDRLTPVNTIEKRLRAAAEADMVIVLYNPESKSRSGYLKKAAEILMETLEESRICGVARNIKRHDEKMEIMTLKELTHYPADMFCTVFIGNSSTEHIDGHMITKRGYRSER